MYEKSLYKKSSFVVFALMLILALTVAACVPVTPAASTAPTAAQAQGAKKPIKIGLAGPHDRPIAFVGEGQNYGATLAIEDMGGAIEGYPIQLVIADNKNNPTDAINAARKLIEVDQVDVILDGGGSSAAIAEMPIVAEGKTPAVSSTSTAPAMYAQMVPAGTNTGSASTPTT